MAVLLRSWRDEKEKKRLKRKTLRGLKVLKSKVEGRKKDTRRRRRRRRCAVEGLNAGRALANFENHGVAEISIAGGKRSKGFQDFAALRAAAILSFNAF
jgi:hypothetical protein